MSDTHDMHGGAPPAAGSLAEPPADPLADEVEARAAELRALIKAAPMQTEYGPPAGWLELRERRRRRVLLAIGGLLMAAGALTFVLIMTGISLLGVAIFTPGVLLLALATGWRPFYWVYLPGFALAGMGLGMIADRAVGSPMILSAVGLGCGLTLAWLIRRVQVGWAHLWPLVFGVFFAGFGVLAGFDHPWSVVAHVWPLLLVVVGLIFVVRAVLPSRRAGEPPVRR
ncbi:MAG TPA: hypothetical protein VL117_13805 [Thermoleophilia bacterium]|nr:hypothetical protein [Thermoleophilia bacterium]